MPPTARRTVQAGAVGVRPLNAEGQLASEAGGPVNQLGIAPESATRDQLPRTAPRSSIATAT